MTKKNKSQWDFGELFPTEQTRAVLSVSALTTQIKRLLEKSVGAVWVSGEITNLRAQASGHYYFTLKDEAAQLSCVLFRGTASSERELLADGQKVLLQGDVTVYEARGQYQLIVRAVELQGVGALQIKFEQLKRKLAGLGWFDAERKRDLPRYPQRIGLVTSPTGAAIRDVLHVIQRRAPGLEVILAPCRVQGEGAAKEIAEAIRALNQFNSALHVPTPALDLILVTRGGGSLEDLWAFNEEAVAQAIVESALPIVSAVGHEIDFTISDFVADFRAATPSAAAEIITEGLFASREFILEAPVRLRQAAHDNLHSARENCGLATDRLSRMHPRRRLHEISQRLDDLQTSLSRRAKSATRERAAASRHLIGRLVQLRPHHVLAQKRNLLKQVEARLRSLGPEQVLARGYSITSDAESGRIIRRATEVKPGQTLKTRLKEGEVRSTAR